MVNRVKIIFVNGKEEMGNLKIINKKVWEFLKINLLICF